MAGVDIGGRVEAVRRLGAEEIGHLRNGAFIGVEVAHVDMVATLPKESI